MHSTRYLCHSANSCNSFVHPRGKQRVPVLSKLNPGNGLSPSSLCLYLAVCGFSFSLRSFILPPSCLFPPVPPCLHCKLSTHTRAHSMQAVFLGWGLGGWVAVSATELLQQVKVDMVDNGGKEMIVRERGKKHETGRKEATRTKQGKLSKTDLQTHPSPLFCTPALPPPLSLPLQNSPNTYLLPPPPPAH